VSEILTLTAAWCALALLLGGLLKGSLGVGMPLVAVPLLALVLPIPAAVALLPIPIVVANVWQALRGGYLRTSVRRFWPLLLTMTLGTAIGAKALASLEPGWLYGIVGVAVIGFSLVAYFRPTFRLTSGAERFWAPIAGLAAGLLGGISTMFGPVLITFLTAVRLPKDQFVACIGALYLIAAVPLTVSLIVFDVMDAERLMWSSMAVVPVGVGMILGQLIRARINERAFANGVLVVLLITGVTLLERSLF